MSLTTFADLVVEAERQLAHLASVRDLNHRRLVATWPAFLLCARHALTAGAGARPERWYAIDAAQSRVAGLLAAGAHLLGAALNEAERSGGSLRSIDLRVREQTAFVEILALSVLRAHPATKGRADDIAAVALGDGNPDLAETVELWAGQARDTLLTRQPSARDLQGLAGDLAQVSAHSRVLVRAAVSAGALDPAGGRELDAALGSATIQWLDATRAWDGLHTPQPPTPAKVALSHQLAAALTAVTRDGKDWAHPEVVAQRIDVQHGMRLVRRGQDVAGLMAATLPGLAVDMVDSGLLFVPARTAAPAVASIDASRRRMLAPADRRHVADLQLGPQTSP